MQNPPRKDAKVKRLELPRTKGGHFLLRVQKEMVKLMKSHGEVVARMKVTETGMAPATALSGHAVSTCW